MRVCLTVEQLWQPVPGGSGTYIRELSTALARIDGVTLAGAAARHPELRVARMAGLPSNMDVTGSLLPRTVLYQTWNRLRWPGIAGRPRPDVVHATTWAIPRKTAPLVVTVHDLAFVRAPEHFTAQGVRFFERALEIVRREADVVVVPSEATRADCVSAGLEAEQIRVIPHGVSALEVTTECEADFRTRFGLARPYVFWCGAIEPRKNLGVLLDAYAALLQEGVDVDLVLAGPDGWGSAGDELAVKRAALPSDRVHVLGPLSWPDLQAAYAGAAVFAFPSLWEGFGMPVLEAQAHGVPVVTSAGTSMAEVLGDGGLLVDAQDANAVARGLAEALGERRAELAEAARTNAAKYPWAASATAHLAAYREAVSGG